MSTALPQPVSTISRCLEHIVLTCFLYAIIPGDEMEWEWESEESSIERMKTLLSIFSTSTKWRTLAASHPTLWTEVLSVDTTPLFMVRRIMEHSKSEPFRVSSRTPVPFSDTERMEVWAVILDEFARCEEFIFEYGYETGEDTRPITSILGQKAPLLRRFIVSDPTVGENLNNVLLSTDAHVPIFNQICPVLSLLSLSNIAFNPTNLCHDSFSSLSSISVKRWDLPQDSDYSQNTVYHWLAALACVPRLRQLELINAIYVPKYMSTTTPSGSSSRVRLACLDFIKIEGNMTVSTHFMSFIRFPHTCAAKLRFHIDTTPILLKPGTTSGSGPSSNDHLVRWAEKATQPLLLRCHSGTRESQWDLRVDGTQIELHIDAGREGSYLLDVRGEQDIVFREIIIQFFHRLLTTLSEKSLPRVRKLSLSVATSPLPPALHPPLLSLLCKMHSVQDLYLNGGALQALSFEVLQCGFHEEDLESDDEIWMLILPNVSRLFVDGSTAASRSMWGFLKGYIFWRLEVERYISHLYVVEEGDLLTEAIETAIYGLPSWLPITALHIQDIYTSYAEGVDPWSRDMDGSDLVNC